MYIYKYIIIYNIKNNRYKGAFIGTREGLIKGVGGPFRRGYVVPSKVLGRDYRGTTEGLLSTFVVPSYSHNKKAGVFLGLQLESMLFFTPEKTTYYKTPFLAPYAGFN